MNHEGTLLLTGGSGLLALNWARIAAPNWVVHSLLHRRTIEVPGAEVHNVELDEPAFKDLLDRLRPDLVVHTAGMTSVEACEADHEGATQANVAIPAIIARACFAHGTRFIHISTDHIGAGSGSMATETDPIAPVNHYARTKAEAERVVLAEMPDALVLRTNFFGWGPRYRLSFSDRILRALRASEEIVLFSDVFFTPILTDVLVEVAHELAGKGASGIIHAVGDERLTKHEFGLRLAEAFDLDPSPIRAGLLTQMSGLTRRPFEMGLSNQRARNILGHDVGSISEQLARLRVTESDPHVKDLQRL